MLVKQRVQCRLSGRPLILEGAPLPVDHHHVLRIQTSLVATGDRYRDAPIRQPRRMITRGRGRQAAAIEPLSDGDDRLDRLLERGVHEQILRQLDDRLKAVRYDLAAARTAIPVRGQHSRPPPARAPGRCLPRSHVRYGLLGREAGCAAKIRGVRKVALKGRTILRIVVLTIVAALLIWRHVGGQHRGSPTTAHALSGTMGATASSAPPVKPPPLRHWQLGTLNLTSCELPHINSGATTAAWCTNFDVPENPARPGGRHIGLHLAVVRSDAARPDADMVVMIAGGPGEAATKDFADTAQYSGVLKHHNVLLLDQRGTGDSNPLSCAEAAKAQRAQAPGTDVFD